MNFLITSIILIVAVTSSVKSLDAEKSKNVEKFGEECIKESGTTLSDVENLKKGDYTKTNEKLECFTKCLLERGGFMEKGKLNEKTITAKLQETEPKDKVEKILKVCKEIKGKDECQLAFNILKCYSENKSAIV